MDAKTRGNKLYTQNKLKEAITAYSKGIETVEDAKDQESSRAAVAGGGAAKVTEDDKDCLHILYCNRSMAYLDSLQLDEALQDAECAVDTNPEYAKAYLRRAAVYVELFLFKDALADLDKAEVLQPGSALEGCELRRRAEGKLWKPNCYLKKQMQLKSKHKCDYVLQISWDGEEIVEPVKLPRESAKNPHKGAPAQVVRDLIRCGEGGEDLVYNLCIADTKLKERVGNDDFSEFQKKVQEQLRREFGPNKEFDRVERVYLSSVDAGSVSSFYFLYHATQQQQQAGMLMMMGGNDYVNTTPILYPGAPQWVYKEEERQSFAKYWTAMSEETFKELHGSILKHRENMKAKRKDGNKCHGCGTEIADPDPQECLCGHIYCSLLCHNTKWPSHQQSCHDTLEASCTKAIRGHSTMTEGGALKAKMFQVNSVYWSWVLEGTFPCKAEPDFVKLWEERNMSADTATASDEEKATAFQREIMFYVEQEVAKWEQDYLRMGAVQEKHKHNRSFMETVNTEHIYRWYEKLSTPLLNDSCARVVAKCFAGEQIEQYRGKIGGGNGCFSYVHVRRACKEHLKKHRSDDSYLRLALHGLDTVEIK